MKTVVYASAAAAVLTSSSCCHVEAFAPPSSHLNVKTSASSPVTGMMPSAPSLKVAAMPPLMMSKNIKGNNEEKDEDEDLTPALLKLADTGKESSSTTSFNPTPAFIDMMSKWMGLEGAGDKKMTSMQLAAATMAFALAFMPLNNADAAMSGGRMGGSFSAPRQSISRPAPSSSYSRGYSSGYSSGYMSRPGVTITPGFGFGYSPFVSPFSPFSPFNPFSPFAPRVYGGPGIISVSRGPSFFDLLFIGGFMFAVSQIFLNQGKRVSSTTELDWTSVASSALGSGTSVAQLSVALEVPNRDDRNSILGVLERLSETARTDSRVGVQNLTSQVALELLRRRSSIVSASSSYKHFNDRSKAIRDFQSRSVKERSKFENESTSKFGGVDYGTSRRGDASAGNGQATMVVVTLVLAIDGDSTKLPRINTLNDVEDALRRIASDSKVDDCLQGAEILWTPDDRSETLTLRDVVADYPELRSV